jgi:iron complex transport system substrate-binding protein
MKKYNKLLPVLLVLAFALVLVCAGCAKEDPGTTEEEPGPTGNGDEEAKIIVTDGLGREIALDKPAERVIVAYGLAEKMVFALGAQDSLAAASASSQKDDFFTALKPDIVDIPALSGQRGVNVEEVISLQPDLVLLPGRNREMVDTLEEKGINVFGVVAEDLDLLKNTMTQLGKAFGKEEKAREFVKYYDDTIKLVKEKTASLSDEEKPVVYLSGSSFLTTCAQDVYQNDLITLAGGRNAAGEIKGGQVEISPEQLIEWNPDFILAAQYTTEVKLEDIFADKRWQGINAVINEQVFWFPSNLTPWDYPSAESILGIKWLAQKLHPELFEDVDMIKEADDFYLKFYGKAFTELGGDLTSHSWGW